MRHDTDGTEGWTAANVVDKQDAEITRLRAIIGELMAAGQRLGVPSGEGGYMSDTLKVLVSRGRCQEFAAVMDKARAALGEQS